MKILLTEDELKSKGNSVLLIRMQPYTEIKSAYHKQTIGIFHILRGNPTFFFSDEEYKAQQGDTLCANLVKCIA